MGETWPPVEWIREETTFEQIKEIQEREMAELGIKAISPSWLKKWKEFKRMKKDENTLHLFRSSEESWQSFSGAEGYVICSNGKPITFITTKQS